MPKKKIEYCDKCGGQVHEIHTCPYQFDVNKDSEYECNCCNICEFDCAMDV